MSESAAPVPASRPTGGGSEQGEDFRRQRLAVFFQLVTLLSGASYVVGRAALALRAPESLVSVAAHPANVAHLVATLLAAAAWFALSRIVTAARALDAIDVAGTFVVCATFSFMIVGVPSDASQELVVLLAASWTLVVRAALVPCRAQTTALVGVVAMAPVVIAANRLAGDSTAALERTIDVAIWALVAVVATTVISRIIYGLRRRVAEAMRVGQYTLEEKIGEGAMGVVFLARHALLRRPTAIKLLHERHTTERDLARFEREVQMTSQLSHPNTIAIYDFGRTPEGSFYYAMEHLEGITLEELVELDGPQPPSRVAHLLAQVCSALDEAHGTGLVHRDIKPANVFLTRRGGIADVVKVLDFGLVKVITPEGSVPDGWAHDSSSQTLEGTPLYMAPEAITSPDTVDGRSDLYSLGATAYFLLAGKPPFSGATLVEVCSKHLHETPASPSLSLDAPVPPKLEALVLRCLAKEPRTRAETAASLADELTASVAERWSAGDASAWWTAKGDKLVQRAKAQRRAAAGSVEMKPRTIAVDVSRR
jgi:hypothetical protein